MTGGADLGWLEGLLGGINPAVMKSRYGLKCHRQGSDSLLSIGSHRCGAGQRKVVEGLAKVWTMGMEWVAFTQAVVVLQGWT